MLLRRMKIAPRAILSFSLVTLLVILLGLFALHQMKGIRASTVMLSEDSMPSYAALGTINEKMLRLRIVSFRILVDREPELLRATSQREAELTSQLHQAQEVYEKLVDDGEEAAQYARFKQVLADYYRVNAKLMQLSDAGQLESARAAGWRVQEALRRAGRAAGNPDEDQPAQRRRDGAARHRPVRQRGAGGQRGDDPRRTAHRHPRPGAHPQHRHAAGRGHEGRRDRRHRQPHRAHRGPRQRRAGTVARLPAHHAAEPEEHHRAHRPLVRPTGLRRRGTQRGDRGLQPRPAPAEPGDRAGRHRRQRDDHRRGRGRPQRRRHLRGLARLRSHRAAARTRSTAPSTPSATWPAMSARPPARSRNWPARCRASARCST